MWYPFKLQLSQFFMKDSVDNNIYKIIKEISERFELYEYQVLPTVKEVVRKHAVYKF